MLGPPDNCLDSATPRGARVPPFRFCSSLVHSLPHLLLFFTFSLVSFSHSLYLFFFCCLSFLFLPELSHSILQAGGRRRRPNLGLVCFVHFVLSVLLS